MMSRFDHIPLAQKDPILGLNEEFQRDRHKEKLNLGVGAFRTEEIQPYVLRVVQEAELAILDSGYNKEYLPIEGLSSFNEATVKLLLGVDNSVVRENRVATVQGISGTGSLRLGAEFLATKLPGTMIYISKPSWGNHKSIFTDAGMKLAEYRYFDPKTIGLDFTGMIYDLQSAPEGSIILLHGCAHNPTGIDPTMDQWKLIADVIEEKGHLPFFDVAYQGFASGDLDTDAFSVRYFVNRGIELLVAQSYSKNLGLYSERIGALSFISKSPDVTSRIQSQVKRIARAMYSNPPSHGAQIVAHIVGNPARYEAWKVELRGMAERIKRVRQELYSHLKAKDKSSHDWSFVLNQIGMFSYTGLNHRQVQNMVEKWHIYMTADGRISLAGLPVNKTEYLSDALIDSVKFLVIKGKL